MNGVSWTGRTHVDVPDRWHAPVIDHEGAQALELALLERGDDAPCPLLQHAHQLQVLFLG